MSRGEISTGHWSWILWSVSSILLIQDFGISGVQLENTSRMGLRLIATTVQGGNIRLRENHLAQGKPEAVAGLVGSFGLVVE